MDQLYRYKELPEYDGPFMLPPDRMRHYLDNIRNHIQFCSIGFSYLTKLRDWCGLFKIVETNETVRDYIYPDNFVSIKTIRSNDICYDDFMCDLASNATWVQSTMSILAVISLAALLLNFVCLIALIGRGLRRSVHSCYMVVMIGCDLLHILLAWPGYILSGMEAGGHTRQLAIYKRWTARYIPYCMPLMELTWMLSAWILVALLVYRNAFMKRYEVEQTVKREQLEEDDEETNEMEKHQQGETSLHLQSLKRQKIQNEEIDTTQITIKQEGSNDIAMQAHPTTAVVVLDEEEGQQKQKTTQKVEEEELISIASTVVEEDADAQDGDALFCGGGVTKKPLIIGNITIARARWHVAAMFIVFIVYSLPKFFEYSYVEKDFLSGKPRVTMLLRSIGLYRLIMLQLLKPSLEQFAPAILIGTYIMLIEIRHCQAKFRARQHANHELNAAAVTDLTTPMATSTALATKNKMRSRSQDNIISDDDNNNKIDGTDDNDDKINVEQQLNALQQTRTEHEKDNRLVKKRRVEFANLRNSKPSSFRDNTQRDIDFTNRTPPTGTQTVTSADSATIPSFVAAATSRSRIASTGLSVNCTKSTKEMKYERINARLLVRTGVLVILALILHVACEYIQLQDEVRAPNYKRMTEKQRNVYSWEVKQTLKYFGVFIGISVICLKPILYLTSNKYLFRSVIHPLTNQHNLIHNNADCCCRRLFSYSILSSAPTTPLYSQNQQQEQQKKQMESNNNCDSPNPKLSISQKSLSCNEAVCTDYVSGGVQGGTNAHAIMLAASCASSSPHQFPASSTSSLSSYETAPFASRNFLAE